MLEIPRKVKSLIDRGAIVPSPFSLEIDEEVDLDRISCKGLKIHAGCRVLGKDTVISKGCEIGAEGPVTIENCQIGKNVKLKGGYFKNSVFLDKSSAGAGAHVREACILEEESSIAHAVGLKQTILFPFVTLGSLINFCDALLSGGTSRKDHTEVGSSYIHFNYTPNADKATASLLGDVPRGVMLDRQRIFLGGQGGLVGPAKIEFGVVVAAGYVQRGDLPEPGKLVIPRTPKSGVMSFSPGMYPNWKRIFERNVEYIANIHALAQWYSHARRIFLTSEDQMEELVLNGAAGVMESGIRERVRRFGDFLEKLAADKKQGPGDVHDLYAKKDGLLMYLSSPDNVESVGEKQRDEFLKSLLVHHSDNYLESIKGLTDLQKKKGTDWLQSITDKIKYDALSLAFEG
ncbi:MAG: UDP-N-acetylglucosamine pyrophosphorylase [Deltaproteobacteria bacterium]|nr:UDP-N-acetylglucosamine pyrophosphorylase [Deltaproteobacteria bacterium]